ncbi:unnamed protein product [Triticum turgidum subsp. durum]|uniref:Uncharacterized protein n=1 Tax=Triticum turgidum subsp. durum TaxID=4567 RepID=A0A9R0WM75_TRITD|nr:unnamed protein product [Triticum turgidum subsp. durum]
MGESPPPTPPPPAAPAKVYYEGCPGCAMERRKESSTGTPYKELFFVGITTFASSLPITSLFPFLYFMIQDLHVAQREEDIGFYAGFLVHHIWLVEVSHRSFGAWLQIASDGSL